MPATTFNLKKKLEKINSESQNHKQKRQARPAVDKIDYVDSGRTYINISINYSFIVVFCVCVHVGEVGKCMRELLTKLCCYIRIKKDWLFKTHWSWKSNFVLMLN